MKRRDFKPHGPGCPCEAWVEVVRGAEGLPCPAMFDAYNPGEEFAGWRVAHRLDGSASKGVKVWSWWERRASTGEAP